MNKEKTGSQKGPGVSPGLYVLVKWLGPHEVSVPGSVTRVAPHEVWSMT